MSTLLAEPIVLKADPILDDMAVAPAHFPAPEVRLEPVIQPKNETSPLMVVLIASAIAFHVSLGLIGAVAAWIYEFQYSGAFTP